MVLGIMRHVQDPRCNMSYQPTSCTNRPNQEGAVLETWDAGKYLHWFPSHLSEGGKGLGKVTRGAEMIVLLLR